MKKQLLVGLATGLFLYGMTNTAMANPFTGNTTGIFSDSSGGVVQGIGSSTFSWGNGSSGGLPSSLEFAGTSFISVAEDVQFQVGTLNFFNGIIEGGSGADSATLDISLMFSEIGKVDFSYSLNMVNTPNTGNADHNADYVYLPTAYPGTGFKEGGIEYTLTLGFGTVDRDGFSTISQFHVFEKGNANAQLMGTITSDVAPVPEPATMLLFGTGMAGLAGYRRRQQAKKK